MYVWIWRNLPGGTGMKSALATLLLLVTVALLLFVVFPAVAEHVALFDPAV